MKTTYTPGPWGIEQTKSENWIGPIRKDGVKVAEIVCSLDREGYTAQHTALIDANARLIAAAPELLEALRQYLISDQPHRHESAEVTAIRLNAAAAVAKATGN